MFRRTMVGVMLVLATAATARAQLVVIDPANLSQTILIAERTWQHYQELRQAAASAEQAATAADQALAE